MAIFIESCSCNSYKVREVGIRILFLTLNLVHVTIYASFHYTILRQGVPKVGGKSGVSGHTRLLPGTLAHTLVLLHNALPTGHETTHNE
jgi:hypothetical protein